jgi:glycerol kinase
VDLILALDAGTTGVRTVAFDASAAVVDSTYRELTQYFPRPGEVEHDATEIAELALATLREVAERSQTQGHRIVALGITNQRETTVAFDRATGAIRHHAIVWQDRRTASRCEELTTLGALPRVRAVTGLVLDSYFSGTKMRWLMDHGAIEGFAQPALATIDAFLLWTLTGGPQGGVFATEPSNASRTMLMDLETLAWSTEMSSLLGVPVEYLPTIEASAHHFGAIAHTVIPELADVPITAMLGDQQAALFGQACFSPGMVKATYGTGAFILANAGHSVPPLREGLVTTVAWDAGRHDIPAYAYEGSAFVAGAAIQWLRDELQIISSAPEVGPLAESVSDSGGVIFVPAFTGLGSPFWRSEARGVLMGLSTSTTKAHIARAVVEALAFQVRAMTEAFAEGGVALQELRADGGAAAMDLLLQLQATSSRLTVRRSRSLEATAQGAALMAGLEVGLWGSLEVLSTLWGSTFTAEPEDPTFADLGYTAWLDATTRA